LSTDVRLHWGGHKGELAWKLALSESAYDLAGVALLDLATAYGQLSRYRRQVRTLRRYLDLLERMNVARVHEPIALYRLGWAFFHMGENDQADACLSAGLLAAERWEDSQTADICRRLKRSLRIRTGQLAEVPPLLEQSSAYMSAQPQDRAAAYGYWHGLAELAQASGRPAESVSHALKALEYADSQVNEEVECHLLLCESAIAVGDLRDALGFALSARVCAIEGERYDLAYGATTAINDLVSRASANVLEGFSLQFARHGLNVFRYIPTQLLNRGTTGA